ncbi:hypothetical protein YC2023_067304 [Brassica napus]
MKWHVAYWENMLRNLNRWKKLMIKLVDKCVYGIGHLESCLSSLRQMRIGNC